MKTLLTTAQAAERLGVHGSRVRALIAAGRLPATLIGTQWVITEAALAKVAVRVNGRPRKNERPNYEEIARAHKEADARCGRKWQCACGACQIIRKSAPKQGAAK